MLVGVKPRHHCLWKGSNDWTLFIDSDDPPMCYDNSVPSQFKLDFNISFIWDLMLLAYW